ncbi:phiSA1p31-related protein [Streptomyces sp. NPDC048211]|uniref:phiSA1p31-related protein n=1 Tax=Streptomyces sp. NPDC048211 TaxID=3365516 RepID=UPI003719A722
MNTYVHEGVEFDLALTYADVTGVEWVWTGRESVDGEPLMRQQTDRVDCQTLIPLPTLYWNHGPLIPISPRPTHTERRIAVDVDPNYADTVAAGYVESPAAFAARIAAPAPLVPTAPGSVLAPSPLEQTGFRRFLSTLTGGRSA